MVRGQKELPNGSAAQGLDPGQRPFDADLQIDEGQYRRHLDWLARAGVGGITTNGHAAEVSVLSREKRAMAIALETVAGWVPVVAGIYAESHAPAADLAQEAEREGAELGRDGVREFLSVCLPLKFPGRTGSPVRPIAVVPG